MYSRLYSSNSLVARSQNNKNQNIVDFSTLSETEKRRYVQLLQKNKVDVEKDPNDNLYIAHIKVVKQQHLEQEINDSTRSYTPDLPHDSSMSRSFSKQDMHNNTRAKSEMRDRSFQATNRSIERESSREKPKFTSITPDDTKRTLTKARNMKSTEQLINREAMEQYRSTRDISPSSSMKKLHQNEKSRAYENSSPEQSRLERRFTQRSKSPISDCTKECYNYYFDFCQLANMANCVNYLRPKKIPLESLNKIVEEIFSLQFVQGTSMVKAVVSRKLDYDGSPGNSFADFVLKYLKERTRNLPRAVEQNVLNLAYSVYWFRKKSPEVELFSRFLSGEASDDDLTFFLFLRFSTEKEINVSLPNYPASPSNITMSVRSCYRILEIIYGKYQKELLNDLTQKIKDFIFEERERRHDFAFEGIPVYSFLYITFEDYFFNKQRCRDNIAFEPEDIINETTEEKEESHRDIIYYSAKKDKSSPYHNATSNWQSAEKRTANPTAAPPRNSKVSITEGDDNKKALKTSSSNKTYQKYVKPIEKPTSLNILAPVPSQDNSPGHRKKRVGSSEAQGFSSTTSSTGNLDFLQEFCVNMMLEKINEFIDIALFERKNVKESHKEFVKVKLLDIFKRKFNNIIKALFSFDKMKWLDALLIEDPTNAQLQNVEVLQKELRELRKLTLESLDKQSVMVFTNRILRTPELSVQIGRLILEFDYDETAGNKERP